MSIEDRLAEPSEQARRELPAKHPRPDDCPPDGTWGRLCYGDETYGVWHNIRAWDDRRGSLRTRCGHPRNLMPPDAARSTSVLRWAAERPDEAVCGRCIRHLSPTR